MSGLLIYLVFLSIFLYLTWTEFLYFLWYSLSKNVFVVFEVAFDLLDKRGGFSTFGWLGYYEIVFLAWINFVSFFLYFSFWRATDKSFFFFISSSFPFSSSFTPKTSSTIEHFGIICPILSVKAISSISGYESEPDYSFKEYLYLILVFIAAISESTWGNPSSASTLSLSFE